MKKKKISDDLPLFNATLKIRVNGFNQARILNRFSKEKIRLKNVKLLTQRAMEFNIQKKDSKKTFAILENMCYDYSIIAESGTHTLLRSCLNHIGLLVGAIVFIAAIAFASQMVWRIEIDGNSDVDSKIIMRSLDECGVKIGSFKSKVDADKIAKALRNMDGIAESTVQVVGTRVVVSVIEEKDYIPPKSNGTGSTGGQNAEAEPELLVSSFDAEITRISVKSGTATVKVGDKIAAGGVLIRGERISSMGEVMEKVPVRGSVYGRVAFSEKHIFSTTEQILIRSGKKKTSTTLSLLGLTIGKNKPLANAESVVKSSKMTLIPIKVTQTTYYETKIVERERDADAYAESLKKEAVLNNVIKAGGSEIETVTTLTPMSDGLIMLKIYIVAEVLLAEA